MRPPSARSGVTTGCRYCPNDSQCELQEVAESDGRRPSIDYPVYYRNLPVEKDDPFYDRDYNLCILCGRCVRMCQEVRTANALAFKHRGRQTIIGPAFSRTHLEAGCEFCGACVAVCPTGTLREKARAWEGKPDREETTTCSFCGVGCQLRLLVKGDRVIGSLPADDPLVNQRPALRQGALLQHRAGQRLPPAEESLRPLRRHPDGNFLGAGRGPGGGETGRLRVPGTSPCWPPPTAPPRTCTWPRSSPGWP